jgi:hypothetical protein
VEAAGIYVALEVVSAGEEKGTGGTVKENGEEQGEGGGKEHGHGTGGGERGEEAICANTRVCSAVVWSTESGDVLFDAEDVDSGGCEGGGGNVLFLVPPPAIPPQTPQAVAVDSGTSFSSIFKAPTKKGVGAVGDASAGSGAKSGVAVSLQVLYSHYVSMVLYSL